MAILVTRPQPDADTTAEALRGHGHEVLIAPMLHYEPRAWQLDDTRYAAVIATSANALRETSPLKPLLALPLYAVGDRTAEAAREAGFRTVTSASGDATDLRDMIARRSKPGAPLLYLAGADLVGDLAGGLGDLGFTVVQRTTYRMAPAETMRSDAVAAFHDGRIAAVLHYSRRTARAFITAASASGVEITALALPQCCMSETIAAVLRERGASRISVAARPDQKSLFAALDRAIGARSE